jgi:acylphosphatase
MTESGARTAVQVKVTGRVQGVAFRWEAQHAAERLGVTGWVRNEPDGSVFVVAEGEEAILHRFLAYLREGPPAARVVGVDADWREATGAFSTFQVRA